MNFTPSAMSCAQPWNLPAYIGPSRLCMCAICLCSIWPSTSGSVRKAPRTKTTRRVTSKTSLIEVLQPFVGDSWRLHPSAPGRLAPQVVIALTWFLRPRPWLDDAGGEDEVLAQRMTLEAVREKQRCRLLAVELQPEHLVRLTLVPPRSGEHVDDRLRCHTGSDEGGDQ